jgi:predicted nucleic acid-binding protein
MARSTDRQSLERRVLVKARDLAEEVRKTAERVHQEALEAHRLIEIARRHAERGRELSRIGRDEARAVGGSIKWSLDVARRADRRKDEG